MNFNWTAKNGQILPGKIRRSFRVKQNWSYRDHWNFAIPSSALYLYQPVVARSNFDKMSSFWSRPGKISRIRHLSIDFWTCFESLSVFHIPYMKFLLEQRIWLRCIHRLVTSNIQVLVVQQIWDRFLVIQSSVRSHHSWNHATHYR